MKGAYYNEFDPRAAAWLRELIKAGLIAPGDVDERSITDVKPDELKEYGQCHFFAGIGGWSLACRIAGIPDDFPIWTGSCPCQPLSSAGLKKGHADERHLWPTFHDIIAVRRPAKVVGEQVASADGREWLAGIRADLEDLGYACGGADLCSAGISAPNIRQRIYWLADSTGERRGEGSGQHGEVDQAGGGKPEPSEHCGSGRLAVADGHGCDQARGHQSEAGSNGVIRDGDSGRMVNSVSAGLEGHAGNGADWNKSRRIGADSCGSTSEAGGAGGMGDAARGGRGERGNAAFSESCGHPDGPNLAAYWQNFEIAWCRDPRGGNPIPRRIESGTFPMAARVSSRVGLLRGYGNAINAQLAAIFLKAAFGL